MPRPVPRWEAMLDDWNECVGSSEPPPGLALDTETTGFEWRDDAFCASVAWEDLIGRVSGHYVPLEYEEAAEATRELLLSCAESGGLWIFHNAQFDLLRMLRLGILKREELEPAECRFIDTQALAIYQDNLQRLKLKGKGTDNLVHKYLGRDSTEEFDRLDEVKKSLGLKKEDGYHLLPANVIVPYAIRDAKDTYSVWRKAAKATPERYEKQIKREMRVTLALIDMALCGFAVDVPYLEQQKNDLGIRLIDAENKIRDMACQITGKYDWTPPSQQRKTKDTPEQMMLGDDSAFIRRPRTRHPFNPGSPQQLAEVLETIGYELPLTDKGQPRTDDAVLKQCAKKAAHPFLDAIEEYRRLQKLHGTYVTSILAEQDEGILHPSFRQYGTRTGRFSSGSEGE